MYPVYISKRKTTTDGETEEEKKYIYIYIASSVLFIYVPSENKCTKMLYNKKRVLSIYVYTQCVFRERRGPPADRYFIKLIYFLNKFLAKLSFRCHIVK